MFTYLTLVVQSGIRRQAGSRLAASMLTLVDMSNADLHTLLIIFVHFWNV